MQKSVQPVEEPVGESRLTSSYYVGRLTVELPPEARVESVVAASRSALQRRGYTIRRSEATGDSGCVIAGAPNDERSVRVDARLIADSTRLRVRFEPWGDHAASTAIVEDVLSSLGY